MVDGVSHGFKLRFLFDSNPYFTNEVRRRLAGVWLGRYRGPGWPRVQLQQGTGERASWCWMVCACKSVLPRHGA